MKKEKIYPVNVTDCRATYDAQTHGKMVCGNPFKIEFTFDEEWEAYYTKKAKIKFWLNGRYEHIIIEFNGTTCPVPALYNIKSIEVGVFVEDDIGTTTGAIIECEKSINCGASKSVLGADAIDNINKALAAQNDESAAAVAQEVERLSRSVVAAQRTADNALTTAESNAELATNAFENSAEALSKTIENFELATSANEKSEEALSKNTETLAVAEEAKAISERAEAKANALENGEVAAIAAEQATQKANIQALSSSLLTVKASKQDNLAFDGIYNAESNKVATVKTVTDKIANVVAKAPEDFDTLKEIAEYIASDKTGATEINNKLSQHGTALAANTMMIADNAEAIATNAEAIASNKANIEANAKAIATNASAVEAIKKEQRTQDENISANATAIENLSSALEALETKHDTDIGDIGAALDELHAYAQSLVNGGNA